MPERSSVMGRQVGQHVCLKPRGCEYNLGGFNLPDGSGLKSTLRSFCQLWRKIVLIENRPNLCLRRLKKLEFCFSHLKCKKDNFLRNPDKNWPNIEKNWNLISLKKWSWIKTLSFEMSTSWLKKTTCNRAETWTSNPQFWGFCGDLKTSKRRNNGFENTIQIEQKMACECACESEIERERNREGVRVRVSVSVSESLCMCWVYMLSHLSSKASPVLPKSKLEFLPNSPRAFFKACHQ